MSTLRDALGPIGIWSMELRGASRPEVQEAAIELGELGFPALWVPGLDSNAVLDDLDVLLGAAPHATVASAILSIWSQAPYGLGERLAGLDRVHGPRAVIGLGVSNPRSAAAAGQTFGVPTDAMRHYLEQLDAAPTPVPASRRLLGALGPKMADLAATRAAGWHPFMVTPEYTVGHRERVGPGPVIAPHQAVVLDRDPQRARNAARRGLGMFIGFPSYQGNLRRLGFADEDFASGGSDRLIDAVTAWGDLETVARRIEEHLLAGADHVALQVLDSSSTGTSMPLQQWRELAGLLPVPAGHGS
ncbi:MAG: hypothetical protein AVDCRST_MAG47-1276 [uncultured Nocardioidaceae bacterium]|uniref:Luciferase-like domain-containing protein n=1 Tax=uncultured Nocardioidaceae bacterium TaxID=253824 RepID=A0A6J4N080_9ACTN|nr:MAG: hypothetical protein AVDCRST_MAG47-1276 [uncultured Nocardioidaceae bacterium]